MTQLPSSDDVLAFWFEELESKQWWVKDEALDGAIEERFGDLHRAASRCELYAWRSAPNGRLAEVIVLDQFSRNIHRGRPGSFAQDPLALALAQEAVAQGDDQAIEKERRSFLYMPFMHSESLVVHERATELFDALIDGVGNAFEAKHRAIIERFGRYPHRNEILGRTSTPEELEFLKEPGSSF